MQICLAIYHGLIHIFHKEQYRNVTAVGYSAVIFGWMALLSASKQTWLEHTPQQVLHVAPPLVFAPIPLLPVQAQGCLFDRSTASLPYCYNAATNLH